MRTNKNSLYRVCEFLPEIEPGSKYELLYYCISFALYAAQPPLDRYLKGILLEDTFSPAGGDPGWSLCLISDANCALRPDLCQQHVLTSVAEKKVCYEAWAVSEISGIPEETAYYSVSEVRPLIFLALQNIALKYPERAEEVQEIIDKYSLP